MLRYKKLLRDAIERNPNYYALGREMQLPPNSIHDWVNSEKHAHMKSLERISKHFNVPIPCLLMEVGKRRSDDDMIIEALTMLTKDQKKQVIALIKTLTTDSTTE